MINKQGDEEEQGGGEGGRRREEGGGSRQREEGGRRIQRAAGAGVQEETRPKEPRGQGSVLIPAFFSRNFRPFSVQYSLVPC